MKKTVLILGIAIASFATINLVSPPLFAKGNHVLLTQQEDQTKEISYQDLPEAVQKAWTSTKQDGDVIDKVSQTTKGTEVSYTIEYKTSSGQTKSIKFDDKGNELK